MMTFATGQPANNRSAFTLVEMILVMAVMVVALAVVFPSLKGFLRGRNLNNEAGRFLSLTRFGRSRAIAEGLPVEIWINPARSAYGLRAVSGYTESRTNGAEYQMDPTVSVTVSVPGTQLTHSNFWTPSAAQAGGILAKIRFQPDGLISDRSPQFIYFRQAGGDTITLAENPNHLMYEVDHNPTRPALR